MPLFVTERDKKLMSKVNRELIDDILSTKIIYFQISEKDTIGNVYGETTTKYFSNQYIIPCQIEREDQQHDLSDGKYDYNQAATFYFLRDYLLENNIVIEPSNYIQWDNEFYEIDNVVENKYHSNRNPDTSLAGQNFGWNVTIKAHCHLVDRSTINVEEIRF